MRALRSLLAPILALSLASGACGVVGGDDDGALVAALAQLPEQLDPHTASPAAEPVLENVYDTLVAPDDNLELDGALAADVQISHDLTTWTFTLREGVTFHDGSALSAEDVVFSYRRIIDEDLSAARSMTMIDTVEAVDDLTVELTLNRPAADVLAALGASVHAAIVPVEFNDAMAREPVGTGAFHVTSVEAGERIAMEPYEDYWGGSTAARPVVFRPMSDPEDVVRGLEEGTVHWSDNVAGVEPSEERTRTVVLASIPTTEFWALVPNPARAPFDDPRVRRALARAIDRDALVEVALPEAASPNGIPIPSMSPYHTQDDAPAHDPREARELLESAEAAGLAFELVVGEEPQTAVQAAHALAGQLTQVGLDATVRVVDPETLRRDTAAGAFEVALMGRADNLDPADFYEQRPTDVLGEPAAQQPQIAEQLEQARVEGDPRQRKALYDRVVRGIVDDARVIYLYNTHRVEGWATSLTGYSPRADGRVRFEQAEVSD